MNLTEKKKNILRRIEVGRCELSQQVKSGFIKEIDLLGLLTVEADFGLKESTKEEPYKLKVLRNIFNSPFLLCDQECLSPDIKQILPILLRNRFEMEMEELTYMFDDGLINSEEYLEQEELNKFCYYYSSEEGKSILENDHVYVLPKSKIKTK